MKERGNEEVGTNWLVGGMAKEGGFDRRGNGMASSSGRKVPGEGRPQLSHRTGEGIGFPPIEK